jgi:hypothetical protein
MTTVSVFASLGESSESKPMRRQTVEDRLLARRKKQGDKKKQYADGCGSFNVVRLLRHFLD